MSEHVCSKFKFVLRFKTLDGESYYVFQCGYHFCAKRVICFLSEFWGK